MSGRRSARRRPAKKKKKAGRFGAWGVVGISAVIAAGLAFGISRFDFGHTIQSLTLPLVHEDIIRQQAEEKNVPADLIAAVIYTESRFRDQTSSAGARGLMQITPDTADVIENLSGGQTFVVEDLADPELNIRYGTFFLRHLLTRYNDNVVAALAAYNAGIGNADAWGGAAMQPSDIPFPETRSYVEQVLEKQKDYRKSYADELGL